MTVKTLKPDLLIGDRCHAAGAVIELDDALARSLIDRKAVAPAVRIDLGGEAVMAALSFVGSETADASPRARPRAGKAV